MHVTRIAAVAAVSAASLVVSAEPAPAHPFSAVFVGMATTSGTWAPVGPTCGLTTCPDSNTWSVMSATDLIAHPATTPTFGDFRIGGSGSFAGWCGRSTGTGTFTVGSDAATVLWQTAGTTIVLVGISSGHTAVAAVMSSRAIGGTGNCVTAPATSFDVAGVVSAL